MWTALSLASQVSIEQRILDLRWAANADGTPDGQVPAARFGLQLSLCSGAAAFDGLAPAMCLQSCSD